jgi:methyl acetate hydrolase
MQKWLEQNPKKGHFESDASMADYMQPLLFEPGTSYRYSTGLDWAGFFIERRTGLSLEDYFQQNIFKPLGATSMSLLPKPEIMERLMKPCALSADGSLTVLPAPPMNKPTEPEKVSVFNG